MAASILKSQPHREPPDTLAPWRVAAISFLNTAPLLWGLEDEPRLRMIASVPAECADRLRGGEADLGLIPVIEMGRISGLAALPEICIAARSEVRSILLISRCEPEKIRTLQLDRSSRTSAALAQIILRRRYGARVLTQEAAPDWRAMLRAADAGLLIGDPALRLHLNGEAAAEGCRVLDLAAEWHAWTSLPFVFALWAVRRQAITRHADAAWLTQRLVRARSEGFAHLLEISRDWSRRLGIPEDEITHYLRYNLEHQLQNDHLDGLRRFLEMAAEEGLIASFTMPDMLSQEAPS